MNFESVRKEGSSAFASDKCFFVVVLECIIVVSIELSRIHGSSAACFDLGKLRKSYFVEGFRWLGTRPSLGFGELRLICLPLLFAAFEMNFDRSCSVFTATEEVTEKLPDIAHHSSRLLLHK